MTQMHLFGSYDATDTNTQVKLITPSFASAVKNPLQQRKPQIEINEASREALNDKISIV